MVRNTGTTLDGHVQHYIANPEGVVANNRHFIADTYMEYQPNGDATTEGQSLQIIGYAHAYLATKDHRYLDAAKHYWDAYVAYFYDGQPIPDTPQRWIANWLVNAKEPTLAHYPINPTEPTEGGYKCVPINFVNGVGQIPQGAPFWGEYLDVASFAHRGHMTWDAINASVQKIQEDVDGTINWNTVLANRKTSSTEPWVSTTWVNWTAVLGADYTAVWSGDDKADEYPVDWLVSWVGTKVNSDGDILASNQPQNTKGQVKLKDTSINGVYFINYAVKLPVEHGGYMFARNEPWHNRPINTPFLGSVNQMGNAADAELWFHDACYIMWKITGESKYKKAMDAVFFTANEYTDIDSQDKFFRQTTKAQTPFTDGISYSYSFPSGIPIIQGRDAQGYIDIDVPQDAQNFMEQQSVWFRINQQSKLRVTVGAVGNTGQPVSIRAMVDINQTKAETPTKNWWSVSLPKSTSLTPVQYDINVGSLAQRVNPLTNQDYILADERIASDYGGLTFTVDFENNVYDGRQATVINTTHPNGSAGAIIGFWLQEGEVANPTSIVYKSDGVFNVRIDDANGWRWYWTLPNTNGQWSKYNFNKNSLILGSYQPNYADTVPRPSAPVYDTVDQLVILLDNELDTNKHFSWYCVNEVPPLFTQQDGWTLTFQLMTNCTEAYKVKMGDCTIIDYRHDSLNYCPGVIPFSNIYSEGSDQLGAWHGLPYPGYQYPFLYCHDPAYESKMNKQIDFLYDSQQWYYQRFGVLGPGASAYIWNRWDATVYGDPDTWTMYHWGDQDAWAGYQPRAFNAAARTWYELVLQKKRVPKKLKKYVENWIRFLYRFTQQSNGVLPTNFPMESTPYPDPDDFTGHMTGLWLAGCVFASLAGCKITGILPVIEACVDELNNNLVQTGIAGHAMNGGWSPAVRLGTDNGMAFGFWTGEALRGLALYTQWQQLRTGESIYV